MPPSQATGFRQSLLLLVLLLGVGTRVTAAEPASDERWQLLSVAASESTASQLAGLPAMVEGGTAERLHLQMRAADRHLLQERGIEHRLVVADLAAGRPLHSGGRDPEYHTAEQVSDRLRALGKEYPDIVRVVDLGSSWQGRELTGLLVTDQPWTRELDEPSLRVLGTHHGDELSSMEVTLAMLEELLGGYGSEAQSTAMVDSSELWFLPVVNPDGVAAYTRRNSRGVDLNRNYSYLWQDGAFAGEHPFSEVESDAVRALSMSRSFFHGLTLHSGATNLGWVWNNTTDPAPDAEWMQSLSERYLAQTEQPEFWVTNGAQWYITWGDTNDWSYGVRGGHDYTLEVTLERSPDPSLIETFVGYHLQPSLDFLSAGLTAGIRGRITDMDGRPVEAEILPDDPDWPTLSDPETGAFARPLVPGSYQLEVVAEGYASKSVAVVIDEGATAATQILLQLSSTADVTLDEVEGLEQSAALGTSAQLCGDGLLEALSEAGQVLIHRPGLGGPYPLPWQELAESDGRCLTVDIDPTVITDPWLREGEWHLLLEDASGQVRAQLPLGLLLVSAAPGYTLSEVALQADAEGARIDLGGQALPEGAQIRFVGPAGQRRWPDRRLGGDSPEQISAVVDPSGWAEGAWSIRVFGNGHWAALSRALAVEDGILSLNEAVQPPEQPIIVWPPGDKGPPPPPDEPPPDEPPPAPPGDDGSGCACGTGASTSPASAPSLLVLVLVIGYFRRARAAPPRGRGSKESRTESR